MEGSEARGATETQGSVEDSSGGLSEATESDDPYLQSLRELAPSPELPIQFVTSSRTYRAATSHNSFFRLDSHQHRQLLFDTRIWNEVSELLVQAVFKCRATKTSQISARTTKFLSFRRKILRRIASFSPCRPHLSDRLERGNGGWSEQALGEFQTTIYLVGVEFIDAWKAHLMKRGCGATLATLVA